MGHAQYGIMRIGEIRQFCQLQACPEQVEGMKLDGLSRRICNRSSPSMYSWFSERILPCR